MVAVLLLPILLLIAACLLDRLERRVVSAPPATRTPATRPATGVDPPVAPVVPLPRRISTDADTVRLQRAS